MGEAAHGGDVLLRQVEVGRRAAALALLADLGREGGGGRHVAARLPGRGLTAHAGSRTCMRCARSALLPAPAAHTRARAHLVDLLVHLRAVVEAVLARARHAPLQARREPRADARDLAQAAVGLARQPRHAPARHHALRPAALGDRDGVDHLVHRKHTVHAHGLRRGSSKGSGVEWGRLVRIWPMRGGTCAAPAP